MTNFFKSPLLWAVVGLGTIIIGSIYNDKDKYPAMPLISKFLIIAGSAIVGFAGASILKWNPLTKLNAI